MKVDDLKAKCKAAQETLKREDAPVALVIPGKWTQNRSKKLFGKSGGPVGQCVGEPSPGRVVCLFKANEVLAAIEKEEAKDAGDKKD